jgi:hypothetical protein
MPIFDTPARWSMTFDFRHPPKCPACGDPLRSDTVRFRFDLAFCKTCLPSDSGRHYPYVPNAQCDDPCDAIIARCIQRLIVQVRNDVTTSILHGLTFWTPPVVSWDTEFQVLHAMMASPANPNTTNPYSTLT